jgi:hypothetical protein
MMLVKKSFVRRKNLSSSRALEREDARTDENSEIISHMQARQSAQ